MISPEQREKINRILTRRQYLRLKTSGLTDEQILQILAIGGYISGEQVSVCSAKAAQLNRQSAKK